MTTQIYTNSTCDRCGTRQTQSGAKEGIPPNWAYIETSYRNNFAPRETKRELCQKCYFELDSWLKTAPDVKGEE